MRIDKEAVSKCKDEASAPKERLIEIMDKLLEAGARREAASLERIIIRLEVWQNRP